jgi:hypothetical protein
MKKVNRLFHATKPSNVSGILELGLTPGWDGVNYLCSKRDGAFGFMSMRMFDEIRDDTGDKILGFKNYNSCFVFEIDGDKLDWSQMLIGDDHLPMMTDADNEVYAYPLQILPFCLLRLWEYKTDGQTVENHGLKVPMYYEEVVMYPTQEELEKLLKNQVEKQKSS